MNKTATDKIAEILGALTPDELRVFVDTPYSRADAKMAMSIGFCDKLAEYGLVPSDMNTMMEKRAANETVAMVSSAGRGLSMATLGLVISAAVAGNLTGKAHHSLERRMNKMDDKENVRLREKAIRLASQRDELSEDLSSRPSLQLSAPAAPKSKQNLIQLLD